MANVTQKIPNVIGGVSRLPDFDKQPGEVREALNCYPDASYGMTKRPGSEWLGVLGITDDVADDTYFFTLIREGRPKYLVGLRQATSLADAIKIWNLDTLQLSTVNSPTGQELSYGYLNFTSGLGIQENDAYRHASDSRRTVIVNRTKVCEEDTTLWSASTPSFEWTIRRQNKDANSIEDLPDGRAVRINWGSGGQATTQTNPLRAGIHYLPLSVRPETNNGDQVKTEGYGAVIKANIKDGGSIILKGVWRNDEFIESTDGETVPGGIQTSDRAIYDAELWSAGSGYPDQCPMSVDGVDGGECTLATGLLPGYVYRVVNSGANEDDFYMQPFSNSSDADDDGEEPGPRDRVDGPYFWKECPSPDSYVGLNPETLPHELVDNEDGTFTFRQVDYSQRWAGDNTNNPSPSFIGKRINNALFLNNRLGFLAEDNVILSRPINYGPDNVTEQDYVSDDNPWIRRNYTEIDFFRQSAIGMNAADPIDLKVSTNDTSILHKAIPTPQGTILFADGQQSLLYQPQGMLSPMTASINSISNYDMTDDVLPIIIGETCYFVNKGANFCRVYSMVNRGMQNPPELVDVTKTVSDWLPNTLTNLKASLTDEMLLTFTRNDKTIYCRRVVANNFSSWTKWELPSEIVDAFVDHDQIYYLTKSDDGVNVHRSDMYVIGNDASYRFAPRTLTGDGFDGIPDDYDYDESFIGYHQLSEGFTGSIEYYLPWHDYYEYGTQKQYNKWKPLGELDGLSDITASAVYAIQVDDSSPDRWKVGFRFQYKDASNNVQTIPSDVEGAYIYLPYDIKFRLNPTQTNATWLDGCVKTTSCSMLQYILEDGSINNTTHWSTEIKGIDNSGSNWVVTLQNCDLDITYDVTLSDSDIYDVVLFNIARNNCNTDPLSYRWMRMVIDDSTLDVEDDFGNNNPAAYFEDTAGFGYVTDRSIFPLSTKWYERNYISDQEVYFGPLAATVTSWSSLVCSGVDWGRADEFFCREQPGRIWNGDEWRWIYYSQSVNYNYNFSTNGSYDGGMYPNRLDINNSNACTFRDSEDVGDPDIRGNPWGTHLYVDTKGLEGKQWYAPNYSNEGSFCSEYDKFSGWFLGGRMTRNAVEPNVSGGRTVGWGWNGYEPRTPPSEFYDDLPGSFPDDAAERQYYKDEIDTTLVHRFAVSFRPPPTSREDDDTQPGTPHSDYVNAYGQNPPDKIYIRTHYEFTNDTNPYYNGGQVIYTEEDTPTCDSCAPNVLVPPEGIYKDLYISPYLDHYTDEVTLQSVDPSDPAEANKKRLIIPPTNYPRISTGQVCLLIGILPDNDDDFTASDKAGYHVDVTYNADLGGYVSPIDLKRFEGKIVIGYRYDFLIEMPKMFFRADTTDYTASLTISRIKAAFGFSADATLQVRSTNNRAHFTKYFSATKPNLYDLDGSPITQSSIHELPVHRRTEDFYFRIASDSPFPLSVDSVTWEGNYSPRYYRRM